MAGRILVLQPVSSLSLRVGRTKSKILDHQRPPNPQSARALLAISVSTLRPNGQQAPALDAPCQTTSKTGTQPRPLAERLQKVILSSQTPQNTPLDAALPTRKTRSSPTHQNIGTSPFHQEAYRSH